MGDIIYLASDYTPGIESEVPVVPAIFDGDECSGNIFWQGVQIYGRRKLAAANTDQGARSIQI